MAVDGARNRYIYIFAPSNHNGSAEYPKCIPQPHQYFERYDVRCKMEFLLNGVRVCRVKNLQFGKVRFY